MFLLLLLLCDDDDDADFAIVTDEEEDDNFAIVVVFNVVLLTLPLLSPFCVNRVLFSFDAIGVLLMVVTDNMLMFSYLFMRACVCFVFCCVLCKIRVFCGPCDIFGSFSTTNFLVKKQKKTRKEACQLLLEEKIRARERERHFL